MVTCAECGFLTVHLQGNANFPPTYVVADERYRRSGVLQGRAQMSTGRPACALRLVDLTEMIRGEGWEGIEPVLTDERQCDGFQPYIVGLDVQAHLQIQESERRQAFEAETRRRDQEHQAGVLREQRDWQVEQERRAQARHDEQMLTLRQQGEDEGTRHRNELVVLGGVVALATVAAALIEVVFGPGVIVNVR